MSAISVVIADRERSLRASYIKQLRPENGITVVGEAGTSLEVVKSLRLKPHVLLLDWNISLIDDLSILPLVRRQSPGTRIILLGARATRRRLMNALAFGACGYLKRTGTRTFLPKAVRAVGQGEIWIPRAIVATVLATIERLSIL